MSSTPVATTAGRPRLFSGMQPTADSLDSVKLSVKKIRSAVTDTGREVVYDPERRSGVSNLLTILSVLSRIAIPALEERFTGAGYGDVKREVAEAFVGFVEPFQEKVNTFMNDTAALDEVLADGAARARVIASARLADVYDKVGFLPGRC